MALQSPRPRALPALGLALGATLVVLLASAPTPCRGDDVQLIPGSTFKPSIGGRVRGQIESETPSEVVVTLGTNGANSVSVPLDQIASIRYDGQPASFQLGETRESAGQLAEAVEQFRKAASEASDKPLIVQAALFREAEVLADLAMVEPDRAREARERLTRFVRGYPASRHIIPAREALARLQVHANDYAGAESTIADLAKSPGARNRATVLHARLLSRQGRHDEAASELDRVIALLPEKSTQRRDANLAKAECLVGQKKYSEAETLVRQVIAAAPAEDVAAQSIAYNTLGDCLRAANHPKDALLAYLHTDLLYAKDKEEHPRALFQLEKLFRMLRQETRADEYAQRLKLEYPRSPWLKARTAAP